MSAIQNYRIQSRFQFWPRAVASNTGDLRFECRHQQKFISNILTVEKWIIKEKEARIGPIKKKFANVSVTK